MTKDITESIVRRQNSCPPYPPPPSNRQTFSHPDAYGAPDDDISNSISAYDEKALAAAGTRRSLNLWRAPRREGGNALHFLLWKIRDDLKSREDAREKNRTAALKIIRLVMRCKALTG